MEHIGIDVHKRESQICILSAEGELIELRIQIDQCARCAASTDVMTACTSKSTISSHAEIQRSSKRESSVSMTW